MKGKSPEIGQDHEECRLGGRSGILNAQLAHAVLVLEYVVSSS